MSGPLAGIRVLELESIGPAPFAGMGSLGFAKHLIAEAKVAVSPGIGFGGSGDRFVRFALVENEQRIRQAVRGMGRALRRGPPTA